MHDKIRRTNPAGVGGGQTPRLPGRGTVHPRGVVLWAGIGLLPAMAAGAQARGPSAPVARPPVALPAGPADTALLPGRQDFRAYQQPGACLRAAMAVEESAHFADEDTAYWADPARDTLTTATVALARRCGAAFAPGAVPVDEILPLMHLALMAGDDAKARAAAERYVPAVRVGDAAESEAHRWALYAVDTTYLHAKPKRLAAAEAITARLDALGSVAAMQRNKAHGDLLGVARERFDTTRLAREALALITAASQMTAADWEAWNGGSSGVNGVLPVWSTELYRDPTGALARTQARVRAAGLSAADWDQFLSLLRGMRLDWAVGQIGTPLPALRADDWAGADSSRWRWPVPGTVSVYLRTLLDPGYPTLMEVEAVHMAMWRRFLRKYGSALHVTVMAAAHGSFRSGPPLSPHEEATQLATFYREELGVPVTVALDETPVKQLADGRKVRGQAAFEQDPYYGMKFILADKAGKLVLAAPMEEPLEEPMLDAWLAREVHR